MSDFRVGMICEIGRKLIREIMYIGYLPSYVRYHNGLTAKEKLLYCELTAMANANSIVKLDREHLSVTLDVGTPRIRTMLNKLIQYKLVEAMGNDFVAFNSDIKSIVSAFDSPKTTDEKSDKVTQVAEDLLSYWNSHFGTSLRATGGFKSMVRGRLKSFKPEELMQALENRIFDVENNSWYREPENQKHIPRIELALRDDKATEKYVNFIRKVGKIDFGRQTIKADIKSDKSILE